MKRTICLLISLILICLCQGCGEKEPEIVKPDVAVLFTSKEDLEQNQNGNALKAAFEDAGFNVELDYAANNEELQEEQVKRLIADKCRIIIIDAVNPDRIGQALAGAKAAGVCVISFDGIISVSDDVSYYVTFDEAKVGYLQGRYIADMLGLDNCPANTTYNIELFSGTPGDAFAKKHFDSAMEVLQPYINSGVLAVLSGKMTYAEAVTDRRTNEESDNTAAKRMKNLIKTHYDEEMILDAVLCVDDDIAQDVATVVDYDYNGTQPVITGCGCTLESLKKIVDGKQSMTVLMDYRALSEKTIQLVNALLNNTQLPNPDVDSLNNGFISAPVYLCEPVVVDQSNYMELVINTGYYTERQLE